MIGNVKGKVVPPDTIELEVLPKFLDLVQLNSAGTKVGSGRCRLFPMPSALNGVRNALWWSPCTLLYLLPQPAMVLPPTPSPWAGRKGCSTSRRRGVAHMLFYRWMENRFSYRRQDGARNSVWPTYFRDKHMGSAVGRSWTVPNLWFSNVESQSLHIWLRSCQLLNDNNDDKNLCINS